MTPGSDPQPQPERPGPPPLPPQHQPPPQQGPRPPRPPQQQQRRPQQPALRRPLPPRPPPRPRRHHHHGKASRARIGLVVVFVLFRLLDFMALYGVPEELNRPVISSVITGSIWSTALLLGVWLRKSWARFILIALVGLATIGLIILFPILADYPAMTPTLVCELLVNAGVFAWLTLSRDVRRLVSRDRE